MRRAAQRQLQTHESVTMKSTGTSQDSVGSGFELTCVERASAILSPG